MATEVKFWKCDVCGALYGSAEVANDCAEHDRKRAMAKPATANEKKGEKGTAK